jgi:hypothetical protein
MCVHPLMRCSGALPIENVTAASLVALLHHWATYATAGMSSDGGCKAALDATKACLYSRSRVRLPRGLRNSVKHHGRALAAELHQRVQQIINCALEPSREAPSYDVMK